MEDQAIWEKLVRYADELVGEARAYRRLEDATAWNLFVYPRGGELRRPVRTFDEAQGLWERLIGGRRVYGYDEWEGLRLAVTQIHRRGRLRLLVLTAFKPGVRIAWPPRPRR